MPAKPQIEVCNQHFDGIWNPKNLKKHRFGPKTSKLNPHMVNKGLIGFELADREIIEK